MYKERLREEISDLIEKIRLDWSRIKSHSPGIHKLDKDIITNDIRCLYDLIYEFDPGKSEPKIRHNQEAAAIKVLPVLENIKPDETDFRTDKPDAPGFHSDKPEIEIPNNIEEEVVEYPLNSPKPEEIEIPFEQPVVEFETGNSPKEFEWSNQQEITIPAPKPEPEISQPLQSKQQPKSTFDLFTAPKTIADIFQTNDDKSVAARLQHNPITDIKSAIGINEKFLFINTIFRGEISIYNKAIERLNQLPDFYLAQRFLDELKSDFEKEDNKDSFAKLTDIAKRKFH